MWKSEQQYRSLEQTLGKSTKNEKSADCRSVQKAAREYTQDLDPNDIDPIHRTSLISQLGSLTDNDKYATICDRIQEIKERIRTNARQYLLNFVRQENIGLEPLLLALKYGYIAGGFPVYLSKYKNREHIHLRKDSLREIFQSKDFDIYMTMENCCTFLEALNNLRNLPTYYIFINFEFPDGNPQNAEFRFLIKWEHPNLSLALPFFDIVVVREPIAAIQASDLTCCCVGLHLNETEYETVRGSRRRRRRHKLK